MNYSQTHPCFEVYTRKKNGELKREKTFTMRIDPTCEIGMKEEDVGDEEDNLLGKMIKVITLEGRTQRAKVIDVFDYRTHGLRRTFKFKMPFYRHFVSLRVALL